MRHIIITALALLMLVTLTPVRAEAQTSAAAKAGWVSLLSGIVLSVAAFDYRETPGTVNFDFQGERSSICRRGNTFTDDCTDATLKREGMLYAGIAASGLGAILLWQGYSNNRNVIAIEPSGHGGRVRFTRRW